MYDAQGKCIYNFDNWSSDLDNQLAELIQREMKIMQIARMYLFPAPRKVNTLKIIDIKKLARLAFNNKISLWDLFNNPANHTALLSSYSSLERNPMRGMLNLIKEIFDFRVRHPSFELAPAHYDIVEHMQAIYDKHPKNQADDPAQTKIIPTRLYGEFICALIFELESFNAHATAINTIYAKQKNSPLFGASRTKHRKRFTESVEWSQVISEFGLNSLFDKKAITSWSKLGSYLGEIQCAAKYLIHFFSGMRENEARLLPADTYTEIKAGQTDINILRGYTSKIEAQNHTPTFWVTSSIVEKAIIAARQIGLIYAMKNELDTLDSSRYPLFPSLNRNSDPGVRHYKSAPVISTSFWHRALDRLIARWPCLVIQEEDIRELERFDGFRDWRRDPETQIGKPWPLATHQCRRSLAVYGARSGLLSLGSAALQFKQLTDAMASYYRKGNAFAENFLNSAEDQSWIEELEYERRKAYFIQYEEDVINTSSRLWGGEGNRIQVSRDKGQPLIIATDRSITGKKFLMGEMTYKAGPIGGCTNLDHCDKIAFTSILACIDCEKSILDDDRSVKAINRGLNNLKREQTIFVPENPQYKQLTLEINAIYEKLEKRGLLDKVEAIS